jgi:5-methylthioadenosine/S-adenosylhomocysteine deaminase
VTLRIVGALALDAVAGPRRADVLIRDGRIAAVGALPPPAPGEAVIDARDRLLVPGLVNAHTHSPLNLLKGTGDALSHPAFMWRNQADTARRSPDEVRLSALLGAIEHLLAGTTAVIDHFPEQGFAPEHVDAVVEAYRETGLRAMVALRVFDGPYDDITPAGGLPSGLPNPLAPQTAAEAVDLVEDAIARHDDGLGGLVRICPAPSNPSRCTDELLTALGDVAEQHDTALHTHLLETRLQADLARQRFGTTMVRHLDRLGVLGPRLSCAHTIWIEDEDIALMAERGALVVHNPESNAKIGAGIAPVARMIRAGVTVALGTDGASTNDNLDLHEAMRLALFLQRPGELDRRRWPTSRDAFAMATLAGAKALLCDGLGTLRTGAPADLVLHDLARPAWVPLNDPLHQLVFGATGATVDTVIVAGRVLVRQGRITAFDPEPVLREANRLMRHLAARNADLHALAAHMMEEVP